MVVYRVSGTVPDKFRVDLPVAALGGPVLEPLRHLQEHLVQRQVVPDRVLEHTERIKDDGPGRISD